ncbi:MAG: hypothetical protein HPY79_11650 [Bacteroidales bacterium]|nr:hypothetical protein [Bacteroidales bacterium]
MQPLEFIKFKENLLQGIPVFYKTYRIRVNNGIRYIRVAKSKKIIEVNYPFISRISENQLKFLLEWHRRRRKFTNEYDCDRATFNYCTKHLNIDPEEIYNLFKTYNFNNRKARQQRLYELITLSLVEHKMYLVKQFFLKLWKKINPFAKP